MTTRNDIIRKTSLYTIGGLIDPRVLPGYSKKVASSTTHSENYFQKLLRVIENLYHKSLNRYTTGN